MVDYQDPPSWAGQGFQTLDPRRRDFLSYFSSIDAEMLVPVEGIRRYRPQGIWYLPYSGSNPENQRTDPVRQTVGRCAEEERSLQIRDRGYKAIIIPSTPEETAWSEEDLPKSISDSFSRLMNSDFWRPEIPGLPKHRKKGIILVADSLFFSQAAQRRVKRTRLGTGILPIKRPPFRKKHHSHKYPCGAQKAHSLATESKRRSPGDDGHSGGNVSDQKVILPLIEEMKDKYAHLVFACIISGQRI